MTARRRDGNEHPLSFNAWSRRVSELDSRNGYNWCDLDVVWHQYAVARRGNLDRSIQNIMVIETKSHGATLGENQAETLLFLRTHFNAKALGNGRRGYPVTRKERNLRGRIVSVRFWGFFLLEFDQIGPDDSAEILWNKRPITKDQLVAILQFRLSPITLRPRDERDHHGKRDQRLLDLALN